MTVPSSLQKDYASALAEHIAAADEASLYRAYDLGRRFMAEEIGIVDQVALHHATIRRLVLEPLNSGARNSRDRAAEFLVESVTPFEMSLRGHREANARLAVINQTLRQLYRLAGGLNRCRTEAEVIAFSIDCLETTSSLRHVRIDLYPVDDLKGGGLDDANPKLRLRRTIDRTAVGAEFKQPNGGAPWDSLGVPLVIDGVAAGMLHVRGASEDEGKSLVSAAHQISNALERVRLYHSLERKVEERTRELVRAARIKDDFLATVSHELRTPLTSINAVMVLLDAEKLAPLPLEIERPVKLALGNCRRLMKIVNDLLDQTRMINGTLDLDLRPIELNPVLTELFETMRVTCGSRELRFEVSERARGARVVADALRLQQVVDNLLANALKFSGAQRPITLAAECHENLVRVSVADQGIGIPAELQDDVFKAFKQVDSTSSRREGGLGLGLAIAKAIVEAHGGTIGLTSVEGEGTTVHFDLPLAPDLAA